MNKIIKKLIQWKEAGVLSDSQFFAIQKYEEEREPKNIAVYTIISLGAIVICIGIISLIASNWEDLSDFAKLALDFIILIGLSVAIYRFKESGKKWLLETFLVSYFILILASIGLISQIYNTGGDFYQATFFWCAITLPIVFHSTGKITTHIWFLAAIFSITSLLLENVNSFKEEKILLTWTYSILPVLFLTISFPLRNSKIESFQVFGLTSLFWAIFGFLSGTIFLSLVGVLNADLILHSLEVVQGLLLITVLLSGISVYFSYIQSKKFAFLLLIGLFTYTILFCSHLFSFSSQISDAAFFILIWFSVGFIFHIFESKRLFEFAIVSIGLRFLIAYFQLFTSLIFTAFGLIFSGILIIALCVFYMKNREKITKAIGDLV